MFKLVGVLNDCLKGTIIKAVEVIDVNLDSCLALISLGLGIANSDVGKRHGGSSFMTVSLLLKSEVTVKGTVSYGGMSIDIIGTLRKKKTPKYYLIFRG